MPGQPVGGGRYVLNRPLGQGGMGVVWLAHDTRLDEDVALKFIPAEIRGDVTALDDLRRETLKSRRLTHPNIIRIHDLDESPGERPFISMEYVDGPSLAALKAEQEQRLFTWDFLQPLVQQLCEALDYAHGEKVIHRDLKPANMMLDSRGRLKLADFGIAAAVCDSVSRVSQRGDSSGTPAYMSPQQMDGRPPKVTDDIYALGATLYELLASKPPFCQGDIGHQVRNLPADPLDQRLADLELANDYPDDVAALIMACLAKDPEKRPPSARAVAEWIGMTVGSGGRTGSTLGTLIGAVAGPEGHQSVPEPRAAVAETSGEIVDQKRLSWPKAALAVGVVILLLGGWAWFGKRGSNSEPDTSAEAGPSASGQAGIADSVLFAPVIDEGWITLFDGTSTDAWRGHNHVAYLSSTWRVDNGALNAVAGSNRDLVTRDTFRDFELEFEWRVIARGNSGVFYLVKEMNGPQIGALEGLEMQVADDDLWKDQNARWLTGGLVDLIAPAKDRRLNPVGQWNQARIVVRQPHVEHWLNGVKVVEYDFTSPAFESVRRQAGFKGSAVTWNEPGRILLHNFGRPQNAWFRNIRIRRLQPGNLATAGNSPKIGWISLFDGRSLSGWTTDQSSQWRMAYGVVQGTGPKSHLVSAQAFTNFAFKAEILAGPGANGGLYFRVSGTRAGGLLDGYEAQVDNKDPAKGTGSLYNIQNTGTSPVTDNVWFSQNVIAVGNRIVILVNGKVTVDYTDSQRRYSSGKLALQSQVAGTTVSYRNVLVKPLPGDASAAWAEVVKEHPQLQR
jgi:hypothetical protein